LRIVAGKHRSRILKEFEGFDIRPTSDRTKEALFNILQNKIQGSEVLDLFCGSGNLGIEAISRGAKKTVFTDSLKKSVELTKENLKTLKETGEVILTDAVKYLERTSCKFDIIFIDPPYKSDLGRKSLETIGSRELLKEDGIAVFESDRFEGEIEGLVKTGERKYGIARINFYTPKY